jgi:hypothetical protein
MVCCHNIREVYVIRDGLECLALDMTDDNRRYSQPVAHFPQIDFMRQLFAMTVEGDVQLKYALHTCRVHRGNRPPELVAAWKRELSQAIDPLIRIALADRAIFRSLGKVVGFVARTLMLANASAICRLLGFWKRTA